MEYHNVVFPSPPPTSRPLVPQASIAMTFLLMSANSNCREEVTKTALPTIVYLSRSLNAVARCTCAKTLAVLAWHDDSRGALSGVGVARALVGIIEDYSQVTNGTRCQGYYFALPFTIDIALSLYTHYCSKYDHRGEFSK